ncbi:hypothetical protein L0666_03350 [Octadecabacter sp. CECT 8868]|uniref:hypothetical protein n=1 Tax=Octadecabacter algicola TaxID=2909342 RepID=UPI001F225BF9|nr:hypothetical protein [Octadecabacter algicola]MCF2904013.1 hypothetical protein [Octadecabacter algicola]
MLNTAIDNNVHLCRTVLSQFGIKAHSHGCATLFYGAPRPYFPSVITHKPKLDDRTIAHIDTLPVGAGVKDSFATLDLSQMGFTAVVNAHWIARAPTPVTGRPLYRVEDALSMRAWLDAWDSGNPIAKANFTPDILARTDIQMRATPDFHEGVITNRHKDGVTGISNLFGSPTRVLDGLSDLPVGDSLVGYETDPAPFVAIGFTSLGPLTVWIKKG